MESAQKEPLVAVVILNWNGYGDTKECLDSFNRITYANRRLFVVDNGSIDGSAEKIGNDFENVTVLKSGENLGFSGGNNLGIREALKFHPEYILVINNDTVVEENFLDYLVTQGKMNSKTGIVAPLIYDYSLRDRLSLAKMYFSLCRGPVYSEYKGEDVPVTPFKVSLVSGCCMLIRADVLDKIGLFDEKYFLYHEESDFCFRAKKAGFELLTVPEAKIWHKGSSSSKDLSKTMAYYLTRNLLYFVSKNYSGFFSKLCFYLFFVRTRIIMLATWFFEGKRELVKYSLLGIKDYLGKKMGRLID